MPRDLPNGGRAGRAPTPADATGLSRGGSRSSLPRDAAIAADGVSFGGGKNPGAGEGP